MNKLFIGSFYAGLLRISVIYIFCSSIGLSHALAQSISDTEKIFNWGENNFSQFFPDHQMTLTADPWRYRFYPSTNVYLGTRDNQIFVLGGPFGNTDPLFIDTVAGLLTQIESDPSVPACKNPSDGFTATQSDNVVNISSNGQCLVAPDEICETPFSPALTGNAVLSTTTLTSSQYSGIVFALENPNGTILLDILNATKSNKLCMQNTPTDLVNLVTHTNICQSLPDSWFPLRTLDLAEITINFPVTQELTTTSTNQLVPDCFATDAEAIFDLFTGESWIREEGGSFTTNPERTTPEKLVQQIKSDTYARNYSARGVLGTDSILSRRDNSTQGNVEALATSSGCNNCHQLDVKTVGPALRDIGTKHANDPRAVQILTDKILNGSNGVWGPIPMPANEGVSEENAVILANWILSLSPTTPVTQLPDDANTLLDNEGIVVSVINTTFSYIELETNNGRLWVVSSSPMPQIKTGIHIRFFESITMNNFFSKELNRTFDKVTFVSNVLVL